MFAILISLCVSPSRCLVLLLSSLLLSASVCRAWPSGALLGEQLVAGDGYGASLCGWFSTTQASASAQSPPCIAKPAASNTSLSVGVEAYDPSTLTAFHLESDGFSLRVTSTRWLSGASLSNTAFLAPSVENAVPTGMAYDPITRAVYIVMGGPQPTVLATNLSSGTSARLSSQLDALLFNYTALVYSAACYDTSLSLLHIAAVNSSSPSPIHIVTAVTSPKPAVDSITLLTGFTDVQQMCAVPDGRRSLVVVSTIGVFLILLPAPTTYPPTPLVLSGGHTFQRLPAASMLSFAVWTIFYDTTRDLLWMGQQTQEEPAQMSLVAVSILASSSAEVANATVSIDSLPLSLWGYVPFPTVQSITPGTVDNSIPLVNATITFTGEGFEQLPYPSAYSASLTPFTCLIRNTVSPSGQPLVAVAALLVNDTVIACPLLSALPYDINALPTSNPSTLGLGAIVTVQLILFEDWDVVVAQQSFDVNECSSANNGACGLYGDPTLAASVKSFCTNTYGGRSCLCQAGFGGTDGETCQACNSAYKAGPPSNTLCTPCPDPHMLITGSASALSQCQCEAGYTPAVNSSTCVAQPVQIGSVPSNGSTLTLTLGLIDVELTFSTPVTNTNSDGRTSSIHIYQSAFKTSSHWYDALAGQEDLNTLLERATIPCSASSYVFSSTDATINQVDISLSSVIFALPNTLYTISLDDGCVHSTSSINVPAYTRPVMLATPALSEYPDPYSKDDSVNVQLTVYVTPAEVSGLKTQPFVALFQAELSVLLGIDPARFTVSFMEDSSTSAIPSVAIHFSISSASSALTQPARSAEAIASDLAALLSLSSRSSAMGTVANRLQLMQQADSAFSAQISSPSVFPWNAVIGLSAAAGVVVLIMAVLYKLYPAGKHFDFLLSLVCVAGFVADVNFLHSLYPPSSASSIDPSASLAQFTATSSVAGQALMFDSLAAFLALTVLLNLLFIARYVWQQEMQLERVNRFFTSNGAFPLVFLLISCFNLECFKLCSSAIPSAATLQCSPQFEKRIKVAPAINNVVLDLPKLLIQVLYIVRLGNVTSASAASLVLSAFSLCFGLLSKATFYASLRHANATSNVHPVSAASAVGEGISSADKVTIESQIELQNV